VLDEAVRKVRTASMPLKTCARKYGIPVGTLYNKVHGGHNKKSGGQQRLSVECETHIFKTIELQTEWKIPLDGFDIRCLVKEYLNSVGITDARFRNNVPGTDWLKNFIRRHNLTRRLADNVKPARADISVRRSMMTSMN